MSGARWDFGGHRAVVTGGAGGIGRAVAAALGEAGAEVTVFDRDAGSAEGIVDVDIADPEAVRAAAERLSGSVDLLVNNAGITRDRSIARMSDAEWREVIDVNLSGAFYMIREFGARMAAAGGGRIVNLVSINALRGKFGQANYTAAKAGLIGLTKTAAREFGRKGVTVNAVAPGMVMTDMTRQLPAEVLDRAAGEAVLPDLVDTADIANGVLFLLSDAARHITGEVLRIDSGQHI